MQNAPAPPPESALPDIRYLEQRVRHLSRAVAVLTALSLVLSASGFVRTAREPGPVATDSVLVLRALSIVDGNGVERCEVTS
jgi:hypothetical protein